MVKVYLAGGMKQTWRNHVKAQMSEPFQRFADSGVEWLDPCLHGLTSPAEYTEWDLQAIKDCDIVFCYFETSNPKMYNGCYEMGYALALGKPIIFAIESSRDFRVAQMEMILETTATVGGLASGIRTLKSMVKEMRELDNQVTEE